VVRLSDGFTRFQRDDIVNVLTSHGIGCGRYFAPIHLQGSYKSLASARVELPVTESQAARTLALPFFNRLTLAQVEDVCDHLLEAIASVR
jgi:perosamine synthetase